ncbi:hypothetical protein [Clostridium perfringens]|uniref:hypothetical protein n=1 Tax=Clostridium perfringens TaxID=1502 RepID=UPI001D24EA33|nr:hypothetical protein [Clostridium perfringens]EHR9039720.1 hypothetical protein [Clostridium perfringens]ELC8411528.1 hypothetical protein [Clostridium perfringens]MDM0558279.1 hypothetical protein [Clostridium perfringens]
MNRIVIKRMNEVNRNMIIGEEKVKMAESDFIGLCTRLGNEEHLCPYVESDEFDCEADCCQCWAKVLNEHIEVK